MATMTDYTATVEELDEELMAERIAILLEAAGIVEPDTDMGEDDGGRFHYYANRAYEVASQFPSQIASDLFAEYVADGIVTL